MKTIRKSITIFEDHQRMLDELVANELASGESDVFRRAIFEMWRNRKNPTGDRRRAEPKPKTPALTFAERLYDAKITATPEGIKMVTFPTYTMVIAGTVEQGEMTLPVEQVNEETIKTQFDGDKEAIIKIIEEVQHDA